MSSLFWRRLVPIGSTAETYRSMVWNNPTLPSIAGHINVRRGPILDDVIGWCSVPCMTEGGRPTLGHCCLKHRGRDQLVAPPTAHFLFEGAPSFLDRT